MAYESTAYVSCEAVQRRLNELVRRNDRTTQRYIPPFLSAILSAQNKDGVTLQQVDNGNGRKREIRAVYSPRLCKESVSDTRLTACDAGTKIGEISTTYEVDPDAGTFINGSLELRDLIDTCQNDEFYVANTISKMMDVVVRGMGDKALDEAAVLFGVHATTGNDTAVQVATQNGVNISDDMVSKISYLLKISEYNDTTGWAIGGSFAFNRYYQSVGMACCTDALNFNPAMYDGRFGPMPIFDKGVDAAWGENHVGLLVPGALQMLTYNDNRGGNDIGVLNQPTEQWGTIVDPVTGIEFDYSAKFDCRVWTFSIGIAHQLVGMPSDMFYQCDQLNGTTGFWDFQIVNA